MISGHFYKVSVYKEKQKTRGKFEIERENIKKKKEGISQVQKYQR